MQSQQRQLTWIASAFSILIVSPVWASEVAETQNRQAAGGQTEIKQSTSSQEIPALNEIEQPATTLDEWRDQIAQTTTVPITGIRLSVTDVGVEVILETADGQLSEPSTSVVGNTLIVEIPNALLSLLDSDEFQQANPAEGIALISITDLPENRIRVAITGTEAPPNTEVSISAQSLILAVSPGTEVERTDDEEAIQIVVTGDREAGYQIDNATSATRTDTPLRDIPQSVQVVPQQVIEDQRITTVGDALRNVSGISVNANLSSIFSDYVRVRGFLVGRGSYFTNGIRNEFAGYNLGQETANVERIEVLKGPTSVLYGQVEPGGIINILTRQPLANPYYAADLTAGSFEFFRPTIDFSGPLNDSRTVRYRLNAAYQNSDSFVDRISVERYFIAPVISFELGENTALTLEGQYLNFSGPYYSGLPAVGTALSNPLGEVPITRVLDDPSVENSTRALGTAGYRLEHELDENWSIRNAFRYEFLDTDEDVIFLNDLEADNRTVTRGAFRSRGLGQSYVLQTDVVGTVETGILTQELVAGVELRRVTGNEELFNDNNVPSIDLFDPEYGIAPLTFEKTGDNQSAQNIIGVYVQDLLSIGDQWHILVGGRFDYVEQTFDNELTNQSFYQSDSAFSPRVGIVYQPIEPVSLYASFSRSFAPSFDASNRNADGTPFEPTTGEQFEVGVKSEFLDGKVVATLAAYQITKQNVITADPERPRFSLQVGEERSRGIELDVLGEILPGLNLIATYAYTDAEITQDNGGFEGNRSSNVPKHSGSLWLTYEIQRGDFQGLGFGAGIFAIGKRPGDLDNSFDLPGYVRTDAAIYYRRENWQAALNVKNLFDVNYFESSLGRTTVFPGAPLTILGTVSVRF
ncbi:TonB-dependent siderophore receptor [Gloeocapsopsis sp. AAB1 = 1H9]|uniref:TonB-dependent siderophore receptor n=2 Tax=Gloeocapsopsis TaxID=693222 RepID=A0A6N8FQ80_9CHRO|nr:TonB-dependent siderophore receptor [Gloeocapsopsis dulcis]MUL35004.1 TonB-dependent siderophore receptor [Gloeocapsopsis dulcis AAB1 = 1H9]